MHACIVKYITVPGVKQSLHDIIIDIVTTCIVKAVHNTQPANM